MFNCHVTQAADLVTSYEQTRAGFLSIALEKNIVGDPYVKRALAFKAMVSSTTSPNDFLKMPTIRPFLLTAAGLSDKSMQYLTDNDQTEAIRELIKNFLLPAGKDYVDEAVFRYLLIKGDAVGGTMRNRIGALGQEKFVRYILSCLNVRGLDYHWMNDKGEWTERKDEDAGIEKDLEAISWANDSGYRVLAFNLNIDIVKKNVDICFFDCCYRDYNQKTIVKQPTKIIMLGELKGGIDPAGADEHWKTANTALSRIRNAFSDNGLSVKTSFIGAAIANGMAGEIFQQLNDEVLNNAANLTNIAQMTELSNWILDL